MGTLAHSHWQRFVPPAEASAVSLEPAATHLLPGEQLFFRVTLAGIQLGETVTVVGDPGAMDGREVLIVQSRFQSMGAMAVVCRCSQGMTSWVALHPQALVQHQSTFTSDGETSTTEGEFSRPGPLLYLSQLPATGEPIHVWQRLPHKEVVHDLHSAIGALRAWRTDVLGETAALNVLAGTHLWRHVIRVSAREEIRTELGRFRVVRLDGSAYLLSRSGAHTPQSRSKPRFYSLWLSDDELRLPVRAVATSKRGTIRADLVAYRPPAESSRLAAR